MNFYKHYRMVNYWPYSEFTAKEIACKGSGELLVCETALLLLQRLLLRTPSRPLILSAYRSAIHNARVGGAPLSEHKFGEAFDIATATTGLSRDDLVSLAKTVGFTGIGVYKTFVHMDIGRRRTWKG